MVDPSQLPYLLELLDDDSPAVQEAVRREIGAFGGELEAELERQGITLTAQQAEILSWLRTDTRRSALVDAWPGWFSLQNDKVRLETALTLLSDYQDPFARAGRMSELLDELADEYMSGHEPDSFSLAQFLFQQKQLQGTQNDYYNPRNSDLAYVIEERRGIPISLACVYMLVGKRMGVEIEGCNFPGHFLARTTVGDEMVLVDCFNGGKFIDAKSFRDLTPVSPEPAVTDIVETRATAPMIVGRVLNNLTNAYNLREQTHESALMQELLGLLREHVHASDAG